MKSAVEFIAHISTKPWSDYTQADYTLQQWHDACLIHNHEGSDYTKGDCKLPVRTPNGALNKYGVFAAAAALDGARRPIDATPQQKLDAAKKLVGYYKEINSQPPKAMLEMIDRMMHFSDVGEFLEHHGVKGMHWGTRKDKRWAKKTLSTKNYFRLYNGAADKMNSHLIKKFNSDHEHLLSLEKMTQAQSDKYMSDYEKFFAKTMNDTLREQGGDVSPSGRFVAHFVRTPGTDMPRLIIRDTQMGHASDGEMPLEFEYEVVLDKNGRIVKVNPVNLQQSDDVSEFLSHYGIRGMHWGIRHKPVKKGRSAPRTSSDFKETAHLRGRKASELSNNQLKKLNERLNLEQNYNRLNPTTVKRGHGKVKAIVGAIGAGVGLYNTLNSPGGKFAIAQAKKFFGRSIKSGVSSIGKF